MKFFSLATAALVGTAAATPNFGLQARDISSSNTSLSTYTRLDQAVKPFNPSSLTVVSSYLTIRNDSKILADDLQSALSILSGSSQFGLFDSISLFATRLLLEPIIAIYLLLMTAMKPQFDSILGVISVRKDVLSFLEEQSTLQQQLDSAFASVLHPLIAPLMTPVALVEKVGFEAVILVYQIPAPAGHIEVPGGDDFDSASLVLSKVPAA